MRCLGNCTGSQHEAQHEEGHRHGFKLKHHSFHCLFANNYSNYLSLHVQVQAHKPPWEQPAKASRPLQCLAESQTVGSLLNVSHPGWAVRAKGVAFASPRAPGALTELPPRHAGDSAFKLQDTPLSNYVINGLAMKHSFWKSLLPLGLCISISFDGLVTTAFAQDAPARIDIVVVGGEGITSNIRQRVAADPVVRIEDDDHRPVAGAAVVFALPVSGTSGEFANGSKTLTVVTDKDGLATGNGLKTNEVPGKLQIYVTASFRGLRARVLINQLVQATPGTRVPPPDTHSSKSSGKWKWALLGVAAAAGAGAGIYFGRDKSTSSPVSISTGTVVFGSPR